jgi:hypothetical protein
MNYRYRVTTGGYPYKYDFRGFIGASPRRVCPVYVRFVQLAQMSVISFKNMGSNLSKLAKLKRTSKT